MNSEHSGDQNRLDQVATQWSLLRLAHQTMDPASPQARQALVLKYREAIRSYVLSLLHGQAEAEDVAQDVIVRLMQGDFGTADPSRGRFRDFLKVAVKNMVRNYWSRQQRRGEKAVEDEAVFADQVDEDSQQDEWSEQWRNQLLQSSWDSLQRFEEASRNCFYFTVLRLRTEHPEADSAQLAEHLSQETGKPWRADSGRQQLRRARLKFAELLVEELSASIPQATPEVVEEELVELGLIGFVRPFLPDDWLKTGELREQE
ncbi:MAG: sigma-70 family RNA polymerase sigma factor [Pirellulales bacterium]